MKAPRCVAWRASRRPSQQQLLARAQRTLYCSFSSKPPSYPGDGSFAARLREEMLARPPTLIEDHLSPTRSRLGCFSASGLPCCCWSRGCLSGGGLPQLNKTIPTPGEECLNQPFYCLFALTFDFLSYTHRNLFIVGQRISSNFKWERRKT